MEHYFCAIASLSIVFGSCGPGALDAPEQITTTRFEKEDIMMEAEQIATSREQIGKLLLAIVSDPERTHTERHEAARMLAKLQYLPAIDALIQVIDLVDPNHSDWEPRPDLAYPITMTLAEYGNAAVPQIVDAYLGERNQQRQTLLAYAIRFGKTTDIALRYLRGMAHAKEGDWLMKQNMEALEKQLKSLAEKVVAPDHQGE